jgi:hypothetical protein
MPFQKGNKVGKVFTPENQPEKNGRPAGVKNRATIAKKWLDVEIKAKNPLSGVEEMLSQEDLITLAQIRAARESDSQAYKVLMDSRYGAPRQDIEIEGKQTINIRIE